VERCLRYETTLVLHVNVGTLMTFLLKKDLLWLSIFGVILVSLSISLSVVWPNVGMMLGLSGGIIASVALQLMVYRHLKKQIADDDLSIRRTIYNNYAQIESLFSLFSLIKIADVLPPMRSWAISPDFANLLLCIINEHRPKIIMEMGSGVSTLIAAYGLKKVGNGSVISLEHDEKYALISMNKIHQHGLDEIATVEYELGGRR